MQSDHLIPRGGVLLHIGPYKTGSTTIQKAMARRRGDLLERGVLYPGKGHRQDKAGWGLLGRAPRGREAPREEDWARLVRRVAAATSIRTCISTEDFCSAGPRHVQKIVTDLGSDRLQVVAVARRLDRLLPSQWQQRVKTSHETVGYEDWLRQVLDPERSGRIARQFWRAHDLERVIARWVPPLHADQFTVLVSDDTDRDLLPRAFESMLGLPAGFLAPEAKNTSLSLDKVELLRRLNEVFDDNRWDDAHHLHLVRRGVLRSLEGMTPRPGDPPVPPLPGWAADRVAELSTARVAELEHLGVRVMGAPAGLIPPTVGGSDVPTAPESLPMDAAVAALVGMASAAIRRVDRDVAPPTSRQPEDAEWSARSVAESPARDLVRELGRRAARRMRSRGARG